MPFLKPHFLGASLVMILTLTACQHTTPANQAVIPAQAQQHNTAAANPLSADTSMIPMDAANIVINKLAAENSNHNAFLKNSPEATLMQALNTLYYGNVAQALVYFDKNTPNLEQKLNKFQPLFKQYAKQVVLTEVDYCADKTTATLKSQVYVSISSSPKDAEFKLQQDSQGVWKITAWQFVD